MHLVHGFFHGLSLTNQNTGSAVSAVHAGTGDDQISDTGKSCKCLRTATHSNAKSCDLGDSSCHKSCFCIIPAAKSIADTCCKRNDIFKRTAKLDAKDIRACIYTENRGHKQVLDMFCRLSVLCSCDNGCRDAAADLLCMARAGKNCDVCHWEFLLDLLRHCHQRCLLNALCHTDNQLPLFDERIHLPCHSSGEYRRNRKHKHLFIGTCDLQVCCKYDASRDLNTWEILTCIAFLKRFNFLWQRRPRRNFMTILRQHHSQGNAPCSRSYNADFCHNKNLPFPVNYITSLHQSYFPYHLTDA